MEDKRHRRALTQAYRERPVTGGVFVIVNRTTGRQLLQCEVDLSGSRNRFTFMTQVGSCPNSALQADWKQFGRDAFEFCVLEEIEKGETQTLEEFREDLLVLYELWKEKLGPETLY